MSQQIDKIQITDKQDEIEIDLLELLFYYRIKLKVIIAAFAIGALIAGFVTYYFITPKFTATAKMYMVSSASDSIVDLTDLNIGTSLSSDYEEMIKIRPIFEEVIKEEELDYTYGQMLGMVTISTIPDTRILTITAKSSSPAEAQIIANALAEKAVTRLPKLMDTSKPNIAEHAILPEGKSSPSYSTNIMIGALGAVILVLSLLTFFYVTDDTLKTAEDVENAFGVMPLTVIQEGELNGTDKQVKKKKRRKKIE